MKNKFSTVIFTVLVLLSLSKNSYANAWVSGFWTAHTATHLPPEDVDVSSLTHLVVAFVLPNADGSLDNGSSSGLTSAEATTLTTRVHALNKKAILSIGGANSGASFRAATQPNVFPVFVKNLIQLVDTWKFDGVDIDWESILPTDYSTILTLAHSLKSLRPKMILTIDVTRPNSNSSILRGQATFYSELAKIFDQINIMTYRGSFISPGWVVWHSSPLYGESSDHPYSVSNSVQQLISVGIPVEKLGIGFGFFGSCWSSPVTAPLQPLPATISCSEVDYINILNQYMGVMTYNFDQQALVPYLSSATPTSGKCGCTYISYEDETSIHIKVEYLKKMRLGGAILWDLNSGHVPNATDPDPLQHTVWRELGSP